MHTALRAATLLVRDAADDKLAIISPTDMVGVIIENANIAETQISAETANKLEKFVKAHKEKKAA